MILILVNYQYNHLFNYRYKTEKFTYSLELDVDLSDFFDIDEFTLGREPSPISEELCFLVKFQTKKELSKFSNEGFQYGKF